MAPPLPGPSLGAVPQTVLYHRDPLGVLLRARARFGPVFALRFARKGEVVVVASPAALGPLLEADPATARAGAARRRILPLASPRSSFGSDGEQHRASRGRIAPAMAADAMAALEPRMAEIAERRVARWPLDRPFRVLPRMRTIATEIFVRLVLGVQDEDRARGLVHAVRRMLWTPGNPPMAVTADGVLGSALTRGFEQRMAPLARLLAEELAARRMSGDARDDVLGRMLRADPRLSTEAIVDELVVVIAAAQEPPSIALTNVVYELARRPEVADRMLAAGEDDPFPRAVVAEVLRLRPPAQAALRELTAPADVDGHTLPAGTLALLSTLLLHRDAGAFPDPAAFRPERFLDGAAAGAPYLPFGGGVRRCVGEALAESEFRTVLPAVLRRLRLRPAWPREERMVVRGTVLVPHRSALVRATARG